MDLKKYIRDIEDFPIKWVVFKDIAPILSSTDAFNFTVDEFAKNLQNIDKIVALDARWFIFWGALSYKLWIPFIPVRKAWKLPYDTISIDYDLEYWKNTFEIHTDSIIKGDNIAIIDDLLATWWTAAAAVDLVEKLWWKIVSINFLANLTFLEWEKKLNWYKINSLVKY